MVTPSYPYPHRPPSGDPPSQPLRLTDARRDSRRGKNGSWKFRPRGESQYKKYAWYRRNQPHAFMPGGDCCPVKRARARARRPRFNHGGKGSWVNWRHPGHNPSPGKFAGRYNCGQVKWSRVHPNPHSSRWRGRNSPMLPGSMKQFPPGIKKSGLSRQNKWDQFKPTMAIGGSPWKPSIGHGSSRWRPSIGCAGSPFKASVVNGGSPWVPSARNEELTSKQAQDTMKETTQSGKRTDNQKQGGDKDSLMYSLEGRSCPPAPRHEPEYLLEGMYLLRDWGASPSVRSGMSCAHPYPQPHADPANEQENALRRIDRQLEDFRANHSLPMENIPEKMREKLEQQDTVIASLEEDNYVLRSMVMDLQSKLLATDGCQSPLLSVAENSPMDECSVL